MALQGDDDEADYDGHGDVDQGGGHEGEEVAAQHEREGVMTAASGVELNCEQDSGVQVEEAVDNEVESEWEAQAQGLRASDAGPKRECGFDLEGEADSELDGQHKMEEEECDILNSMQLVHDNTVIEVAAAAYEPQDEPQVQGECEGQDGAAETEIEAGVVVEAGSEVVMEEYYKFSAVELALIAAGLSSLAVSAVGLCCGVAAGKLAEAATGIAVDCVCSGVKVRPCDRGCLPLLPSGFLNVFMVWHVCPLN